MPKKKIIWKDRVHHVCCFFVDTKDSNPWINRWTLLLCILVSRTCQIETSNCSQFPPDRSWDLLITCFIYKACWIRNRCHPAPPPQEEAPPQVRVRRGRCASDWVGTLRAPGLLRAGGSATLEGKCLILWSDSSTFVLVQPRKGFRNHVRIGLCISFWRRKSVLIHGIWGALSLHHIYFALH